MSVFALIAYSAPRLRFKERPFVDSLTSSTHFVSPAVFGLVLAGAHFTGGLWALLAAYFLWGIASHAFGAVQDILADREGGIGSIATVIGGKATVRFAFFAYLAAGILLLFTRWPGPLAAILMLPYAVSVLPFWSITDVDAEAREPWLEALPLAQFRHRILRDDAADRLLASHRELRSCVVRLDGVRAPRPHDLLSAVLLMSPRARNDVSTRTPAPLGSPLER